MNAVMGATELINFACIFLSYLTKDQMEKTKYFGWQGRLPRLRYFILAMLNVFIAMIGSFLIAAGFAVGIVVIAAAQFRACALNAQRLHDMNKPDWWQLAPVAAVNLVVLEPLYSTSPVLGILLLIIGIGFGLYLNFWPGTAGANNYGEPFKK